MTTDGRTALAVTIQDEGAYGNVYLRDGDDFQIEGIPFHIETFPERGEVTVQYTNCQAAPARVQQLLHRSHTL